MHLGVSQFFAGTIEKKTNCPMPNRTIVLMSGATITVGAGSRSWTEHQG